MVETVNIHDLVLLLDEIQMDITEAQEPISFEGREIQLSATELEYYSGYEDALSAIRDQLELIRSDKRYPEKKIKPTKSKRVFNRFSEIEIV